MKTFLALAFVVLLAGAATGTPLDDPDYLKITYIDRLGVGHAFLCYQMNGTWYVGYQDTTYDTSSFHVGNETGHVKIV